MDEKNCRTCLFFTYHNIAGAEVRKDRNKISDQKRQFFDKDEHFRMKDEFYNIVGCWHGIWTNDNIGKCTDDDERITEFNNIKNKIYEDRSTCPDYHSFEEDMALEAGHTEVLLERENAKFQKQQRSLERQAKITFFLVIVTSIAVVISAIPHIVWLLKWLKIIK